MNVRIEASWREALAAEFDKLYFGILTDRIRSEYQSGRAIYPPAGQIFRALDLCPLDRVRVVILGQDPYHGAGQAEGLAFSVPSGIAVPPSLVNIKREIADDLGHPSIITGGELLPWVEQGVLLLNTTLTVRSGEAASHQGLGWETFTDAVIQLVSQRFCFGHKPLIHCALKALHLCRALCPYGEDARFAPTLHGVKFLCHSTAFSTCIDSRSRTRCRCSRGSSSAVRSTHDVQDRQHSERSSH